jgi:hypothetical protein
MCVDLCADINTEESGGQANDAGLASEGRWRIEVQVETDDLAVRDRVLDDVASWRRTADGVTSREVDLINGGVRVQSHGRGMASGGSREATEA